MKKFIAIGMLSMIVFAQAALADCKSCCPVPIEPWCIILPNGLVVCIDQDW